MTRVWNPSMMGSKLLSVFLLLLFQGWRVLPVESFLHSRGPDLRRLSRVSRTRQWAKSTLTEETVWKIRFVLKGIETEKGKKTDAIYRIDASFIEEEGYEPPQGVVRQIVADDPDKAPSLKISKSFWQLSEDPEDRKDGLWIWGLFKEPLYPFMLLKIETDAIPLDDQDDSIKPLQLFAQINHRRDAELGVILEATDLKVRQVETIKADPFGAAKVDVYEEVSIGTLSVQPAVAVEN